MKSGYVTHQGTQIFYCRYTQMDFDLLTKEITSVEDLLRKQPLGSVRLLVDVAGTVISPATLNALTKTSLEMKKYIHRTAVLGVEGVRVNLLDLLVKASGLQVKTFKTEEEAKTWLAKN